MKVARTEPTPQDISIIDEYYINGFNRVKAVRSIKGNEYNYNSAVALFNNIHKHPAVQSYIKSKSEGLKAAAAIKNETVLLELKQWAYSDIGDYIGLTSDELKELPPEIRRCIQSYDIKTTTYLPRGAKQGEEVKETNIKIKLVDKIKAIEAINKHIGFYLEDNKQKAHKIDIKQLNVHTLNALLQATTSSKGPE